MTTTREPRVGDQRPGGRATRVRTAILAATNELLTEVGYDALGYDEVAARAGVHKTTVYRRWPAKSELVADAVGLHGDVNVPIPDTGDLATDLGALATSLAATIGSPSGARRSTSLVAAAAASEELAEALHRFMRQRLAKAEAVVERAVERGELPAGTDARVVVQALVGAIWHRMLLTGEAIDDAFLTRLVALVTTGAGAARP